MNSYGTIIIYFIFFIDEVFRHLEQDKNHPKGRHRFKPLAIHTIRKLKVYRDTRRNKGEAHLVNGLILFLEEIKDTAEYLQEKIKDFLLPC